MRTLRLNSILLNFILHTTSSDFIWTGDLSLSESVGKNHLLYAVKNEPVKVYDFATNRSSTVPWEENTLIHTVKVSLDEAILFDNSNSSYRYVLSRGEAIKADLSLPKSIAVLNYPAKLQSVSKDHRFLILLEQFNPNTINIWTYMYNSSNYEETLEITKNGSVSTNGIGHSFSVSIAQSAVGVTLGQIDTNCAPPIATKCSVHLTNKRGEIFARTAAVFDPSSRLQLTPSEAVTGGLFIAGSKALFYSLFEGYHASPVKKLHKNAVKSEDFVLSGEEEIVKVISGESGDVVVQTSKTIYYGKEGYNETIVENLEVPCSAADIVSLLSLQKIRIIRNDELIEIALEDVFARRHALEECPIYDILVAKHSYQALDTLESFEDSAELRGLAKSPGVVSTPLVAHVAMNHSVSNAEERIGLKTKRIESNLIHLSSVEQVLGRGTRIVPFVTWYYSNAALSCSAPSFNSSILHFGICATTNISFVEKENIIQYGNISGIHARNRLVVTKFYPNSGSQENSIQNDATSDFIPKVLTEDIYNEKWSSLEAFTNSERSRAAGTCSGSGCPLHRLKYYEEIFEDVFEAKVGIPFVPKFEVSLGNNGKGNIRDFGPYTMIVVGELRGGGLRRGENNTFDKVDNLHSLMNSNSTIHPDLKIFDYGRDLYSMNDLTSNQSIYQYTFNNRVAGCSKPSQSFNRLLENELDDLGLDRKTANFSQGKGKRINFNGIWSRENYQPCNDTPWTGAADFETETYPILNQRFRVPGKLLEAERKSINERISDSIRAGTESDRKVEWSGLPEKYNWEQHHHPTNTASPVPQLLCAEKWEEGDEIECDNKFIFTKVGRFVVTAILLDPFATACELRVSFIVKVKPLDKDKEPNNDYIVMTILTMVMLFALTVFFFVEPALQGVYNSGRQTAVKVSDRVSKRFTKANQAS